MTEGMQLPAPMERLKAKYNGRMRICPCCGGTAMLGFTQIHYGLDWGTYVKCKDCGIRTGYIKFGNTGISGEKNDEGMLEAVAGVVAIWTRRTPGRTRARRTA